MCIRDRCQLLYAFLELFCFQRVHRMHTAEQFGRKGRQWFKEQFFFTVGDGIADLIVAAVVNTDDVRCNGCFYGFTVVCHQMSGLAQFHLFACTGQGNVHTTVEGTGADTQERQSVTCLLYTSSWCCAVCVERGSTHCSYLHQQ